MCCTWSQGTSNAGHPSGPSFNLPSALYWSCRIRIVKNEKICRKDLHSYMQSLILCTCMQIISILTLKSTIMEVHTSKQDGQCQSIHSWSYTPRRHRTSASSIEGTYNPDMKSTEMYQNVWQRRTSCSGQGPACAFPTYLPVFEF